MLRAVALNWQAIGVLHRQVKFAVLADTAIQHARNIGVTKPCKNLALAAELLPEEVGRKGQVNQFDGDLLLKLPVGAMRKINGAHAAAPDQTVQFVGPDPPWTGQGRRVPLHFRPAGCRHEFFQLGGFQQRTDFLQQQRIAFAQRLQPCRSKQFRSRQGLVKNAFDAAEGFGRNVHRGENLCGGRKPAYRRLRESRPK
jgi:hypothetical protein